MRIFSSSPQNQCNQVSILLVKFILLNFASSSFKLCTRFHPPPLFTFCSHVRLKWVEVWNWCRSSLTRVSGCSDLISSLKTIKLLVCWFYGTFLKLYSSFDTCGHVIIYRLSLSCSFHIHKHWLKTATSIEASQK